MKNFNTDKHRKRRKKELANRKAKQSLRPEVEAPKPDTPPVSSARRAFAKTYWEIS